MSSKGQPRTMGGASSRRKQPKSNKDPASASLGSTTSSASSRSLQPRGDDRANTIEGDSVTNTADTRTRSFHKRPASSKAAVARPSTSASPAPENMRRSITVGSSNADENESPFQDGDTDNVATTVAAPPSAPPPRRVGVGFQCSVPGCRNLQTYKQKRDIERHMQAEHDIQGLPSPRHIGDGRWQCAVEGCSETKTTKGNAWAHVRREHDPDHRFPCDMPGCPKVFKEAHRLVKHKRVMHAGRSAATAGSLNATALNISSKNAVPQATRSRPCRYNEPPTDTSGADEPMDPELSESELSELPESEFSDSELSQSEPTDARPLVSSGSVTSRNKASANTFDDSTRESTSQDRQPALREAAAAGPSKARQPAASRNPRHPEDVEEQNITVEDDAGSIWSDADNDDQGSEPALPRETEGGWECAVQGCSNSTVFKERKYALKHRLKHDPRKHVLCLYQGCSRGLAGNGFVSQGLLDQHVQNMHERDTSRRFACQAPDCTKSYSVKVHLETHVRNNHTENPELIQCETCNKTFSDKAKLTRHTKLHDPAGRPEFKCKVPFCKKTYKTRDGLKVHSEKHHGNSSAVHDSDSHLTEETVESGLERDRSDEDEDSSQEVGALLQGYRDIDGPNAAARSVVQLRERENFARNTAENLKGFSCTEPGCDRSFTRFDNLQRHVREKHSGTSPDEVVVRDLHFSALGLPPPRETEGGYVCAWQGCSNTTVYKNVGNAYRHTKSHAPSLELLCSRAGCVRGTKGNGFSRRDLLNRHIQKVHGSGPSGRLKVTVEADAGRMARRTDPEGVGQSDDAVESSQNIRESDDDSESGQDVDAQAQRFDDSDNGPEVSYSEPDSLLRKVRRPRHRLPTSSESDLSLEPRIRGRSLESQSDSEDEPEQDDGSEIVVAHRTSPTSDSELRVPGVHPSIEQNVARSVSPSTPAFANAHILTRSVSPVVHARETAPNAPSQSSREPSARPPSSAPPADEGAPVIGTRSWKRTRRSVSTEMVSREASPARSRTQANESQPVGPSGSDSKDFRGYADRFMNYYVTEESDSGRESRNRETEAARRANIAQLPPLPKKKARKR